MAEPSDSATLRIGWKVVAILAVVSMAYAVIVASTPLLGEEEFAGTTFPELVQTNPRLADVIWHDTVGLGTLSFGVAFLAFLLAWRGLSQGSRLAWYGLLVIGVTFLGALLLAHVPIGNTSLVHIGPGAILLGLYLVALAAVGRSVFASPR